MKTVLISNPPQKHKQIAQLIIDKIKNLSKDHDLRLANAVYTAVNTVTGPQFTILSKEKLNAKRPDRGYGLLKFDILLNDQDEVIDVTVNIHKMWLLGEKVIVEALSQIKELDSADCSITYDTYNPDESFASEQE